MRSEQFSGRTVDEAIFHGLNEMGVSIDEVIVETIQKESKGLFGIGAKNAVVRLTEREVPVTPVFDTQREPREPRERRNDRPRDDRNGRGRDDSSRSRDDRSRSRDDRPRDDRPREPREERKLPEIPYSDELAATNEAAQFLAALLDAMKIKATVQAAETEDGLKLNILSETDGLLIGRRGETLDALQYLVSLYLNKDRKEAGYRRVSVDTEGYRARREDTLRRLARRNAVRVAKTGRAVAMEPMNPYERRVLHSALQGFRGVSTHSEGEEPNRRVIITPADNTKK